MSFTPRKRFGQHFLHDPGTIGRIIDAIAPRRDDRLVEIGCIELDNRFATGRVFHRYVNPERDAFIRELLERALARLSEPGPPPGLEELLALRTGSKAQAVAPYREAIDAAIARSAEAGEGGEAYRHVAE